MGDWQARTGLVGLSLVLAIFLANVALGLDPFAIAPQQGLAGPSADHLFGTDELGRDLFSRVALGLTVSLYLSLAALAVACLAGIPWGLLSGYGGLWIDRVLMRFADTMFAFPAIVVGIATAVVLGPGRLNAVLAIAFATAPQLARLVRGEVLGEANKDYVASAVSLGATKLWIAVRHILPNVLSAVIVFMAVSLPRAILLEASLGYLGLSQQPPAPSLGSLVAGSRPYMSIAPWYAVLPGAVIVLVVASMTMLGTSLADATDPVRRKGMARAFR